MAITYIANRTLMIEKDFKMDWFAMRIVYKVK